MLEPHEVSAVVAARGHQCWGDVVTVLATTALRISESAGLIASDVDLDRGLLHVNRQPLPGWLNEGQIPAADADQDQAPRDETGT